MTPTEARVQSSVRRIAETDHNAICAADAWYVFITVERSAGEPDAESWRLETTADTYQPVAVVEDSYRRRQIASVNGSQYDPPRRGWLLFRVSYADPVERATLRRGDSRWRLPPAAVERLRAQPPAFELLDATPPERPAADEPFDVAITVRNEGGAGTFRGAFNFRQPTYIPSGVTQQIGPTTTTTFDATVRIHSSYLRTEPGEMVAATLISPNGAVEWEVTLSA